eukprot:3577864-Amphidinium_carterae.1
MGGTCSAIEALVPHKGGLRKVMRFCSWSFCERSGETVVSLCVLSTESPALRRSQIRVVILKRPIRSSATQSDQGCTSPGLPLCSLTLSSLSQCVAPQMIKGSIVSVFNAPLSMQLVAQTTKSQVSLSPSRAVSLPIPAQATQQRPTPKDCCPGCITTTNQFGIDGGPKQWYPKQSYQCHLHLDYMLDAFVSRQRHVHHHWAF